MKKITITGLAAILTLAAAAQDMTKPITFLPQKANGILILNTMKFTTVTDWKVDVQTLGTDGRGNSVYSTETTLDLGATYYNKMDSRYLDGKHYITVKGMDARGNVVTTEGPEKIDPNWGPSGQGYCSWRCIGRRYAYQIDLMDGALAGQTHLTVVEPNPPSDRPYYYQWIAASDWNSWSATASPSFYGLDNMSYDYNKSMDLIIKQTIPTSNPVHDENGFNLTGDVYGVRKWFGQWNAVHFNMQSDELASDPGELCSLTFPWAMATVNTATNHQVPLLDCDGDSWGDHDGTQPPIDNGEDGFSDDCIDLLSDLVFSTGDADVATGMFDVIDDCTIGIAVDPEGGDGNSGGHNVNWPEGVLSVTFEPYLANTHVRPVVLTSASMFDAQGNYIGQPFTIGAGLNHVVVQYKNGDYKRGYFVSPKDRKIGLTQSDFVTATAFPVPITGNDFTLELKATAHVTFTYVLSDVNGNPLFRKSYELQQGADLRDAISVPRGIPAGVLFNQLQFSDGSQISFQTVK